MNQQGEKLLKSRYGTARRWLIFWTVFIGLGAMAGGLYMLLDPSGKALGMDAMLPFFQKLPFADLVFQDFTFSGVALIVVNGLTNLTAAGLLLAGKKAGIICGGIFGVTLMLWICIQFYMFPLNFMSTSYFLFGAAQAATGYAAWVFYHQEQFATNPADYPNVGKDATRLVVYFSRLGYGRRLAYEAANVTGAQIVELHATERTAGTAGFWWCGRFGMHHWEMPVAPLDVRLEDYQHVTICAPIWVFDLAAPVKTFCREARGRITCWCITQRERMKRWPTRWTHYCSCTARTLLACGTILVDSSRFAGRGRCMCPHEKANGDDCACGDLSCGGDTAG